MVALFGLDPVYVWIGFFAVIFLILFLDLGLFHKKSREPSVKEAFAWAGGLFLLAMAFAAFVWWGEGADKGMQFIAGYLVELSLSVDNLFVFLLIFATFNIHPRYQHRVLFWGILGALVLRGLFIFFGIKLVEMFDWVFIVFGLLLFYGAYKMAFGKEEKFDPKQSFVVRMLRRIVPVSDTPNEHRFFTVENGKRTVTTLFVALCVIEFSDIVFALDSIPAIFAISTDPFIVFTSNIFAILGLRSLYFVLEHLESMFRYLKTGVAVILVFIATKLVLYKWFKIPIAVSLTVIVVVLVLSIILSVIASHQHKRKHHA